MDYDLPRGVVKVEPSPLTSGERSFLEAFASPEDPNSTALYLGRMVKGILPGFANRRLRNYIKARAVDRFRRRGYDISSLFDEKKE